MTWIQLQTVRDSFLIHIWRVFQRALKEIGSSRSRTAVITNISSDLFFFFLNHDSSQRSAALNRPSPLHTQVRARSRLATLWPVSPSLVKTGWIRAPRRDICAKVEQVLVCTGNTRDPRALRVLNERTHAANEQVHLSH